jgi:Ca2+:H+ antiporter
MACAAMLPGQLAPSLEIAVSRVGAPNAVVGVIIAAVVLLPEGLAVLRAAHANRLRTSLNLASALPIFSGAPSVYYWPNA